MHRIVTDWYDAGRPIGELGIPHEVRAHLLRQLASTHRVFVETGTATGAMLEALEGDFDELYSIELEPSYYEYARTHVGRSPKVCVIQGESAAVLPTLLRLVDEPALIFLDAHYSGPGTAGADRPSPILEELDVVFGSRHPHLIVVDDARAFGHWDGYPTCGAVVRAAIRSGYRACFGDDQIVLRRQ